MHYTKFIFNKIKKIFTLSFLFVLIMILLCNCSYEDLILMHPKGEIGLSERSLILIALGLMLIIVIPVIVMTFVFSVKYRTSNIKNTQYDPYWCESKTIELIIWCVPITIIILLSILTWKSTHKLDPTKAIESVATQPMTINVIALDWKWLFIYPQQNIASINELVFPTNTPIQFNVTSNSVMNSFFIPQLGSQIYAMAGMHSKLHLIADTPGQYQGISSNFSGTGFSGMKFTVIATQNTKEFDQWVHKVQTSNRSIINIDSYEELAKPSKFHTTTYFSYIKPNLFDDIINKFSNQHTNKTN